MTVTHSSHASTAPDPTIPFAVLSRDPDFVQDVAVLLENAGAKVFAAGSWEEYARLQEEGVVVEMAVVDPVFRLE